MKEGTRDLAEMKRINPELQSFEDWIRESGCGRHCQADPEGFCRRRHHAQITAAEGVSKGQIITQIRLSSTSTDNRLRPVRYCRLYNSLKQV